MYKAILFDLDGVLVDMVEAHYEALNKALSPFGVKINREEQRTFFNGLPTIKKLEKLEQQGRLALGLREQINTLKQDHTKKLIPKYCKPDRAKTKMLAELKKRGFKLACCSNAIKETLHLMLKSAELHDYFDIIIGNNEVAKPKPDPEIYLTACRKLNIAPGQTIVVEDSPYGIQAAKASGAEVIIVKGVEEVDLKLFKKILKPAKNEKILA